MKPTLKAVLGATSLVFAIPSHEIVGKVKKRSASNARHAFVLIARTHCGKSLPEIGKFLSGRDHTTVLSSENRALHLLTHDGDWAESYRTSRALCETIHEKLTKKRIDAKVNEVLSQC